MLPVLLCQWLPQKYGTKRGAHLFKLACLPDLARFVSKPALFVPATSTLV
jgi:hypothetical protein